MINQKFLPYAKQSITEQDCHEVMVALNSEIITRGAKVAAFENEIANYCGSQYAVAFSSGSAALSASYFAADVKSGDRIVATPNTFVSTVGTAIQFGAVPVFVDINETTGAADPENLAHNANIRTSRGKTIIVPVHFAGIPTNIEQLENQLSNPETVIIEDAAHAIGSQYFFGGPKVGSCAWSQMTVFSFHPAKTITTGEGGIVTTNDEQLAHRLRLYRNNGIEREASILPEGQFPGYYEIHALSNNYNLTDFQAALGISQLNRIESFIEKRRKLIQAYRKELASIPHISLLTSEHDAYTAFHLCVVKINFTALNTSKQKFMEALKAKGIGTQVHYIPLYKHPAFRQRYGTFDEYFPHTESYYQQALSLPLFYEMEQEDVRYIANSVKELGGLFLN